METGHHPRSVSASSVYSGVDFGNEFFPQKETGKMQNERVEIRGFGPWKRIALSLVVGMIFGCIPAAQAAEPATIQANDTPTSAPVRRNWRAEYPKLMEMGFKEWPSLDGAGTFDHERIRLRDLLKALNVKREALVPPPSSFGSSMCECFLDAKTRLFVSFLSADDNRKNEDGFVRATISNYSSEDEIRQSRHLRQKGTVDTFDLMAQRFQMVRQGEWIRGDIRIDEVMELFQNEVVDFSHVYKPDNASPGTYKLRGDITLQLPSTQPVSSLKDLPSDTLTTVTVGGPTPSNPFPDNLDLKPDLAKALLGAGFEYKKGARFEKRGLTYGEAKAITKSREPLGLPGGEKHKVLKPQREGRSTFGSALIFFESQEANPTWSDDTKVDVSVYIPPQMDEVVKGLMKKNKKP